MKVPNYEQALVPKEKLINYLLDFEHVDGRSKALFYKIHGFEKSNYQELILNLKRILSENDFDSSMNTPWGKKYVVFGYLDSIRKQQPLIKTVWQVKTDEGFPTLITAYPEKELKQI